ncbi:MAG TPA: hypothetical protein VKT32_09520 [Chthonomonadaceae bacterium]|nr:hypothetical protein [Chthonomonadaceae bacterium]
MLRYLNMFVLIGIALVGISIAGFATDNRFLMEPGQTENPHAALIYLVAGILMLINGIVSIQHAPPQQPARPDKNGRDRQESPAQIQDSDLSETNQAAKTTLRS